MKSFEIPLFLTLCYQLEISMSELYKIFAEKFSNDAEIKNLFIKTSNEEINHANQFKFAVNIAMRTKIECTSDIEEIKEKIAEVKEAIDFANNFEYNIKDALRLSLKFETELGEYHTTKIIKFSEDEQLSNLFDAMMKADRGHIEQLKKKLNDFENK